MSRSPAIKDTLSFRYLFKARLSDGRVIRQTVDDVCPSDPKRTAFWDLCLRDEAGNGILDPDGALVTRPDMTHFCLEGERHRYRLDLRTGVFDLDGIPMRESMGQLLNVPPAHLLGTMHLFLVYFRRRSINVVGGGPSGCEYHFGWKGWHGNTKYGQTLILV